MPHLPGPQRAAQLSLFHPLSNLPRWELLPREIRQQALTLLARLLREHWARGRAGEPAREARDE